MVQLTEEELKKAYIRWSRNFYPANCDEKLKPYLGCDHSDGWIKGAREALLLSPESLAQKIGKTRAAIVDLEKREACGTLSIESLVKIAEAMDCELVYAIRPKSRKLFSEIIWERLWPEAIENVWIKNCDPKNRHGALAFLARRKLGEAKFRSKMGWSRRANIPNGREY
jgi:transcriptional regulator with XRE-family HTH domain